jgi:hypothetical protein
MPRPSPATCARSWSARPTRAERVGKRGRRQEKQRQRPTAPNSDYTNADGDVLTLRGSFTPASRLQYAEALAGIGQRPSGTQEDTWQRAVELLFERLAVRWVIAGAPIERQRELLARFRVASAEQRAWVRSVLREHCAEHFPDVRAP